MTTAKTPNPLCFIDSVARALWESDEHVVVTGATGWLGQALLEMLTDCMEVRRIHAYGSRHTDIHLRTGIMVNCKPLTIIKDLPREHSYAVFHFAFLTKEKQSEMSLAEYAAHNHIIRDDVVSFIRNYNVSGLCVASSGAVYTKDRQLNRDMQAYPYAALKVEDEEFFASRCSDLCIPLTIPRIFNMSGPYINKWNAYALSNLIGMAQKNEPLVIKAQHPVIRAYAYVGDLLNVVLSHCMTGKTLTFDACTPEALEIGELAERICKALGRDVNIVRDYHPNLPEDRYVGDSSVFMKTAHERGIALQSVDSQIKITAGDLRRNLQHF